METPLGVDERVDQRGLGHRVPPDEGDHPIEVVDADVAGSHHRRPQEVAQHQPGALVELLAEPRLDVGDALAPPVRVVGLEAHEHADLLSRGAEARAERTDERERDRPQFDRSHHRHAASPGVRK